MAEARTQSGLYTRFFGADLGQSMQLEHFMKFLRELHQVRLQLLRLLPLLLPACLAAWLPGCLAAWLPGCLAAWLPGCLAAWLPGCLAGRLAGWPARAGPQLQARLLAGGRALRPGQPAGLGELAGAPPWRRCCCGPPGACLPCAQDLVSMEFDHYDFTSKGTIEGEAGCCGGHQSHFCLMRWLARNCAGCLCCFACQGFVHAPAAARGAGRIA